MGYKLDTKASITYIYGAKGDMFGEIFELHRAELAMGKAIILLRYERKDANARGRAQGFVYFRR